MKKITAFLSLFCLLFLISSCRKDLVNGNGPVVTQSRPLTNFHGVAFAIPGKLNFSIGPNYTVTLSAQQNILDIIETTIVTGRLEIGLKNDKWVRAHENITVTITAPSSDYFSLSGVGDIDASGDLVSNDLELKVSGTGSINVQNAAVSNKLFA